MQRDTSEVVTMDAPVRVGDTGPDESQPKDWLTREDIDRVIDNLSGADVIEGLADGANKSDAKISGVAFDAAAARLKVSNGSPASQHIKATDWRYVVRRVQEVLAAESPLPEGQTD